MGYLKCTWPTKYLAGYEYQCTPVRLTKAKQSPTGAVIGERSPMPLMSGGCFTTDTTKWRLSGDFETAHILACPHPFYNFLKVSDPGLLNSVSQSVELWREKISTPRQIAYQLSPFRSVFSKTPLQSPHPECFPRFRVAISDHVCGQKASKTTIIPLRG